MDESTRKEQSVTPLPQSRPHSPLHKRLILILCTVAAVSGSVAALYAISRFNYLLFHSLAELFSIAVAWGVFMLVWNARDYIRDNALTLLGTAYLFVGFLDLLHTLSYKGMGVFPSVDASNLATQYWIAGRGMEAMSFLLMGVLAGHRPERPSRIRMNMAVPLCSYLVVTAFLIAVISVWHVFPVCYVEGVGLTPSKKTAEYIIGLLLLTAAGVLHRHREHFDPIVCRFIMASVFTTILAELCFTLYVDVYGFFNMLGHFFKITSCSFIYLALIQSGLKRPYTVLYHHLAEKEQALSRSEEKYRSFIEYTTEGVYRLEMEKPLYTRLPVEAQIDALYDSAYMAECNRAFAHMYGVEDPKELVGSRLIDFHGGRDHPVNREEVRRFVVNDYSVQSEDTHETDPTGRDHWFSNTTVGVLEGNKLKWMWGTQTDITDRKQAEIALKNSEERFRGIVSALPDLIFCIDSDMRFSDVQTSVSEMLVAPADQIIGRPLWDVLPTDIADLNAAMASATMDTGRMQVFHYAMEIKGDPRECETRMVPSGNGEVLAIVRDVTTMRKAQRRLRESEARYGAVVNDQTELICRFTEDGSLTFVNQAYCRYNALEQADVVGRRFQHMICEADQRKLQELLDSLTIKQQVALEEFRVPAADAHSRWTEWTVRGIFDEDGSIIEYQAVGRDITERRRLENLLTDAREREQQRLGQELHDGLCQDLKSLEFDLAILEDSLAKNDVHGSRELARVGKQVNEAVSKAYALAKGLLPVGPELKNLESALAELARNAGERTEVRITSDIKPGFKIREPLAGYHIFRIAQEALNNAVCHSGASQINMIWTYDDHTAELVVMDNGSGIQNQEKTAGGLGLMVMRSRARAMQAELDIRPRPQGGTEVRCTCRLSGDIDGAGENSDH
ncbi:MAG: PAS domain-containing protein [Deltaproteobacteria bacterium]|nr:PAS domain-containing protein [Deltaproteobacteria bacterium]